MASTSSTAFHIGGLISNFDTDAVITAMTAGFQLGVKEARDQQILADARLAGYRSLEANLTALKMSSDRLSKADNWKLHRATVSDSDLLTATATSGASPGQYQLQVQQLAQAEQRVSQGFSDATASLGTGTVKISLGAATFSPITLDSTNNTLQGLSDAINAAGLTVKASIINDGSDSNAYHLLLTSTKTGASRTIGFEADLAGGEGIPAFTVLQEATDAKVVIGNPDNPNTTKMTITSNTNTLSNAIPGVTLQLLQESTSPVYVNVQDDSAGAQAMISGFISNYNAAADFLKTNTAYDVTARQGGILQGDYTAVNVQNQLADMVISHSGKGTFNGLSDIGVTLGTDGHLSISDSAALTTALQTNWDAVSTMFTDSKDGLATRLSAAIDNLTSSNGSLALRQANLEAEHDSYEASITRQTALVAAQAQNFRNQFLAMEQALARFQGQSTALSGLFSSGSSSSTSSSSSSSNLSTSG